MKHAKEKKKEPQPSTSASRSPTREKPHCWLSVVIEEVIIAADAICAMAEDLAKVFVREHLTKCPKNTRSNPTIRSCKADHSYMAMRPESA